MVASGPQDRVFVYYADHGAPGIVGMPFGPFLYADQLHSALRNKSAAGGFHELVRSQPSSWPSEATDCD